MGKDRLRDRPRLVDGLTPDERLTQLERTVYGLHLKNGSLPGLERQHETLRGRVEDLESADRRRKMPFWLRWWVARPHRRKGD